jgi:RNA polymerase sigma-B factor
VVTSALAKSADEQSTDANLWSDLIEAYAPVARSIAARYRDRGIDVDDLEQVALLGLTKAAQRFDPDAGHDFMSYAVPTVRGEVRRHFRDFGWMIRPPRRVQELQAKIRSAEQQLIAELGRSPMSTEVAARLEAPLEEVVEALATDGCFAPSSLDAPTQDAASALSDLLGSEDREMSRAEARIALAPVLDRLSERDRRIVRMRFYEDKSQQEIGQAIGVAQTQVSRILTRILRDLRTDLGSTSPAA